MPAIYFENWNVEHIFVNYNFLTFCIIDEMEE